jgi:serine/threonine-protein kinase
MQRAHEPESATSSTWDRAAYERHLAELGVDTAAIELDPKGSIVTRVCPSSRRAPQPSPSDAALVRELALGEMLGVGGMGVVVSGHQGDLGRAVAVKRVRTNGAEACAQLVREARVTGALEHPNIVPVHSLTSDADGLPMLVMKQIDGEPWSAALARREAAARLEDHLRILIEVCRAVHFAHGRGIVHCDLKPANVMLGTHGEVYVVDWGNAVSIRPEAEKWAPPAHARRILAGTPAYMAPEMAACDGARIDERTDVYLLGAILHRLLTGAPRHAGEDTAQVLVAAYLSEPPRFGPEIPEELAELCARATSHRRRDRPASAEQLRAALVDFLHHRSSLEIAAEGHRRLASLAALPEPADAAAFHRLAIEARFGFQQALRIWPGNRDAREGLDRLLRSMCAHELRRGNRDAARSLLQELGEGAAELGARLAALEREIAHRDHRVAELERLGRDVDLGLNAPLRAKTAVVVGAITVGLVGALALRRSIAGQAAGYPEAMGVMGVVMLTTLALQRMARPLERNRVNARITGLSWLAFVAITLWFGAALVLDVDFNVGLAGAMTMLGAIATMAAITLTGVFRWAGAAYFAAALAILWQPDHRGAAIALATAVALGSVALGWRSQRSDARQTQG